MRSKVALKSSVAASLLVLAIRITGASLQLALVAVVALLYSIEDLGLNGLVWSVALVARLAGTLGLDSIGMKSQAPLWAEGVSGDAMSLARRDYLILKRIWAGLAAAACAFAIGSEVILGDHGFQIIALTVVAVSSAFHRLFIAQRQARNQPILGQVLESVVLPALAIGGAIFCARFAEQQLIASQVASIAIVALLLYIMSPSRRGTTTASPQPIPWRSALVIGTGAALTAANVRVPMFFMGLQSLAAAGTYEVAQKIQSAGSMATTAVSTVYMPRLAVSLSQEWRLLRLFGQSALLSMALPTALLGLLLGVGEERFVELLGSEYRQAWTASLFLLVAATINAASSLVSYFFMFSGKERTFAGIAFVQIVIVLTLSVTFQSATASEMAKWVVWGEVYRTAALLGLFWWHMHTKARPKSCPSLSSL